MSPLQCFPDRRNSYTGLQVCMLVTITRYGFELSCLILGQCSQSNEPPIISPSMREKWKSFPQEIFGPSESKWCFERLPAKSGWSVSCQLDGNPITGTLYIDNYDDDHNSEMTLVITINATITVITMMMLNAILANQNSIQTIIQFKKNCGDRFNR